MTTPESIRQQNQFIGVYIRSVFHCLTSVSVTFYFVHNLMFFTFLQRKEITRGRKASLKGARHCGLSTDLLFIPSVISYLFAFPDPFIPSHCFYGCNISVACGLGSKNATLNILVHRLNDIVF